MKRIIFLFTFLFAFGSFEQVVACSCVSSSACQLYKDAAAIFVGKVVGSTETRTVEDRSEYSATANTANPIAPKQRTYAAGKIFFEVDEAFAGTKDGSRFTLAGTGGSCDFYFEPDKKYLIYAFKNENGTFYSNICTTKSMDDAVEDLEFLRNPPKVGSGAKIFGIAQESVNNYFAEGMLAKRMADLKIRIQSTTNSKKVYFATTDASGKYETNVPVGTYKISPVIPDYYIGEPFYDQDADTLKAVDRQCENRSFWIKNNSEIKGRVVDSKGKPLENIEVELFLENTEPSLNATGESADTDEKGNFTFSGVPLGRYFLSVNFFKLPEDEMPYPRTFYPNVAEQSQAQIIEINNGTKRYNIVFRLPPKLNKYKVEGNVTRPDGTPVANAEVHLMDEEYDFTDYLKDIRTDAEGKFVLEGFEGRKYYVTAIVWKGDESSKRNAGEADSEVFVLDGNKFDVNLVLNENVPENDLPNEPDENFSVISNIYRRLFVE
jgi:hypothetical protein